MPPSPEQMPVPASCRAARERGLRLLRQRAERHIGNEERNVEEERLAHVRPDAHVGGHGNAVEQREARELRGHELDVVPGGKLLAGNAHRGDEAVMPDLGEPVLGELVNLHHVRLLDRAVRIGVETLVHVRVERLRMVQLPTDHLVEVDEEAVAVDHRRELRERLGVVVHAHTRRDAVVPTVQAADEVFTVKVAVGEQRASMETPAVQHRVLIVAADDHELDALRNGRGRDSIRYLAPRRDPHQIHDRPLMPTSESGESYARTGRTSHSSPTTART